MENAKRLAVSTASSLSAKARRPSVTIGFALGAMFELFFCKAVFLMPRCFLAVLFSLRGLNIIILARNNGLRIVWRKAHIWHRRDISRNCQLRARHEPAPVFMLLRKAYRRLSTRDGPVDDAYVYA